MYRSVLRELLATVPPCTSSEHPHALFMHCTTGNNRTGVFISLLLLLLDVPHDIVCKEYALSEQGLAPTRHLNVERLLKKGAFAGYGPERARLKCERMIGAREESMRALIEEVNQRWGGPRGYFKGEVGLTDKEIQMLRTVMTVEEDVSEDVPPRGPENR